jgi:hypothetical protein
MEMCDYDKEEILLGLSEHSIYEGGGEQALIQGD